jgi:glycine hydroxymethyltransferase
MRDKIFDLIDREGKRQKNELNLIPSENRVSKEVSLALGSCLVNKYAEGVVGKRFYQGNREIDKIEKTAVDRAKKLFGVPHANVQPYSGSPANSAVQFGLLDKGDTVMGLSLSSGGHLTHGHPDITFSGRWFNSVQYGVGKDGRLDYKEIMVMAKKASPKLIIAGTTAYSRIIDWEKFREIADEVGAYLMADISHIAGLVVAGEHPSPSRWVDVITTTTHKTLRGPRGAMIMVTDRGLKKDPDMARRIDRAVFPGLQGGPHIHTIAGIAVALKEAESDSFKEYAHQVVKNASVLAQELTKLGFDLVSGGTDNHLMLVDLRNKEVSGWVAAWALEVAGIVVNYNSVPHDTSSPLYPAGIRLGTPFLTTRGMKETEMVRIAEWIKLVVDHIKGEKLPTDKVKRRELVKSFKKRVFDDKYLVELRKEVVAFSRKY